MMEQLIRDLKAKGHTLSTCESLTGGLFASEIVGVSGASAVFYGSTVAYQDEIKALVVGVDQDILSRYTAISKECISQMLLKTKETFNTSCCVALSGNAGPSPSEGKPVGLVVIGIQIDDRQWLVEKQYPIMERNQMRRQVVIDACTMLKEYLG